MVDKIQGESYLGVRIDRGDGLAAPVLNLEPHFQDMKTAKSYEKVVSDMPHRNTFLITNSIMQSYGVTQEQLYADATANMQQHCSIRPFFNVLADMNPFLADEPVPEVDNTLFVAMKMSSLSSAFRRC